MAYSGETIKALAEGQFAANSAADKARVDHALVHRTVCVRTGTTAANTNAMMHLFRLPTGPTSYRVRSAALCSVSGAQAASSDGWLLTLRYDDGTAANGSSVTTNVTYNTSAGALTAPTASNAAAGNIRSFTVGNRVDIPAGSRLLLQCTATNAVAAANAIQLDLTIDLEEV
jgi:hypothetical protein